MTDLLLEAIRSAVRAELAVQLAPLVETLRASQPPRLLSIAEAAAEARVSACTMRRWEAAREVRSVRRGSRVLIDMSSLQPESDGVPTIQCESRAGVDRRGVDPGAGRSTPQRRRGGPQS
jgi:hypothetical protein